VLLIAAALPLAARSQTPTGDPNNLEAVVSAAAAYVTAYQRQLTAIIADEEYRQQIHGQMPRVDTMPRTRTLSSEVFFMYAPGNDWMAIRDVVSQNGSSIKDRPDLREALRTLPAGEVAGTFKQYNSRFNLGRIFRNFNEPTLSLMLLTDRYRPHVTFQRTRVQKSRDGAWVTIAAIEAPGPDTLIQNRSGTPVTSTGEFVVHAGSGRVRSASLRITLGALTVDLSTEYARDARLDIWVPKRFVEHYIQQARDPVTRIQTHFEEIRSVAEYRNYRRFETRVTIKQP
jgi:hypothetical protein